MKCLWNRNNRRGSALLVVLMLLAGGGVLVSSLLSLSTRSLKRGVSDQQELQALYIAESGIAYLLSLEKESQSLGSQVDSTFETVEARERDTSFTWLLREDLPQPSMSSSREGLYLKLVSRAEVGDQSVEVRALFGRGLGNPLYRSALVLTEARPLAPGVEGQVHGDIRVRGKSSDGIDTGNTPEVSGLIGEFVEERKNALTGQWQEWMTSEDGEAGNGYFSEAYPPRFGNTEAYVFPLGDITLENTGVECLTVKGPGTLAAHGDIIIKGCVDLQELKLLAGRNVFFEDSVLSRELLVFARRNVVIAGRSRMDLQALAQQNILVEGTARTTPASLLISSGSKATSQKSKSGTGNSGPKQNETSRLPKVAPSFGIFVKESAVARGILLAAGNRAKVSLVGAGSLVEGLILVNGNAQLQGNVNGCVVAKRLECSEAGKTHCMDGGFIDRSRMPRGLVLPYGFGSQASHEQLQMVSWRSGS